MKSRSKKRNTSFGLDRASYSTSNACASGNSKEIVDLTVTAGQRYRQHLREVVREIYTHATT